MPFEFSRGSRNLKFSKPRLTRGRRRERDPPTMRERRIKGTEGEKRREVGEEICEIIYIYIYNNISIGSKNWGEEGINVESCMHPFSPPLRFRPVAIHPLYSLSPLSRVLNSLSLDATHYLSSLLSLLSLLSGGPSSRDPSLPWILGNPVGIYRGPGYRTGGREGEKGEVRNNGARPYFVEVFAWLC